MGRGYILWTDSKTLGLLYPTVDGAVLDDLNSLHFGYQLWMSYKNIISVKW